MKTIKLQQRFNGKKFDYCIICEECYDVAKRCNGWAVTKDGEFIDNCAHISIFTQDYTFGRHITYMFNRIIDPSLVTGVVINDTVFPVAVCQDVSVRMEMLPKTRVFNWEKYQEKIHMEEISS